MLQAPSQTDGIYLISTKGFRFIDGGGSEPPSVDDIRNLQPDILEQVRESYLLGASSYRAVVTDAFVLVLDRVKVLSGKNTSSGQDVRFLRHIFSNTPPDGLMTISNPKAKGREEFFAGSYATYRHLPSHTFAGSENRERCVEALHAASAFMRILDDIENEL